MSLPETMIDNNNHQVAIELWLPILTNTQVTNPGQRKSFARGFVWTLKFESLQSTDSKDAQKDATTLDGKSFRWDTVVDGGCSVPLPF